ncbi:DUF6932 family protein [Arthrobacter zhaoguopingii]|uniref:DUF6932 family protein n=1 Tax=Arthrobacter zhaoguopingii TaxID=2681491 RepID=UPI0013576BF3|nr:hypothetical protein [Arthrobacter zhaoguopingii]
MTEVDHAISNDGIAGESRRLSPGRHRWTMEEIVALYCPEPEFGQTQRQIVWQHFELATRSLRSIVPVAAVWIGGSFLSEKERPGDVDAVYIVRGKAYDNLSDEMKQAVSVFAGSGILKDNGYAVDSYLFAWRPRPSYSADTDGEREELRSRGYWDDWLQREKIDRSAPLVDEDSFPVRGYVEVILDGFATD